VVRGKGGSGGKKVKERPARRQAIRHRMKAFPRNIESGIRTSEATGDKIFTRRVIVPGLWETLKRVTRPTHPSKNPREKSSDRAGIENQGSRLQPIASIHRSKDDSAAKKRSERTQSKASGVGRPRDSLSGGEEVLHP